MTKIKENVVFLESNTVTVNKGFTTIQGESGGYEWEMEVYPDGYFRSRHCGFGPSDIWTEWEDYVSY